MEYVLIPIGIFVVMAIAMYLYHSIRSYIQDKKDWKEFEKIMEQSNSDYWQNVTEKFCKELEKWLKENPDYIKGA
jgi:hypothetical protein